MPLHRARLKISDYNQNRKSRRKQSERRIRMVSLSLTSMVDMFAILVIFLLVNSSTVSEWIQVSHNIDLPKATKSDQPQKAVTIQISTDGVFGEEKFLVKTADVLVSGVPIIPLKSWLGKMSKKDGYVNIVAHNKVKYGAIKRVIATCQDAGFGKVNLAVQPKSSKPIN